MQQKLRELQNEHEKLKHEYQRVQSVKGAYNADKKMLIDRIAELEAEVRKREERLQQAEQKLERMEQQATQFKNEINFLNGKCSTLKRDLEY